MTPTEERSDRKTAVIVDPHPIVLEGIEQALARAEVEVVAKAASFEEGLALAAEHEPDVFVTEITLSGDGRAGVECVREACRRVPGLRAVVFSFADDPDLIKAAFDAGAAAYVVKTVHPDDLASAVRQAFEHAVFLPGDGSRRPAPSTAMLPEVEELTRRELEILALVAEGNANAEVSKLLWVTEQTVKFHLSNIYRKLRVANRTEATRWALRRGLLPDSPGQNGGDGAVAA